MNLLINKIYVERTDRRVDIQTTLGKQGQEYHNYEFYICTPLHKQYKYRICYFQYGIGNYPVKVVLEQNVADDINTAMNSHYVILCTKRSELEDLIYKVLNSQSIINVMQELIHINQIQKSLLQENESFDE